VRLLWEPDALDDLARAADWSVPQARAVVQAMERMAASGWSLGRSTLAPDQRYWPVPPLGVIYRVVGDELRVLAVVDLRRLSDLP
jgi:hypothetical protein